MSLHDSQYLVNARLISRLALVTNELVAEVADVVHRGVVAPHQIALVQNVCLNALTALGNAVALLMMNNSAIVWHDTTDGGHGNGSTGEPFVIAPRRCPNYEVGDPQFWD